MSSLSEQVWAFVEASQRHGIEGVSFAISRAASEPTLMSLCFAVLTAELYDLLPDDQQRDDWTQSLLSAQDPTTGTFVDPLLLPDDLETSSPG